jgi:hypothetical protein
VASRFRRRENALSVTHFSEYRVIFFKYKIERKRVRKKEKEQRMMNDGSPIFFLYDGTRKRERATNDEIFSSYNILSSWPSKKKAQCGVKIQIRLFRGRLSLKNVNLEESVPAIEYKTARLQCQS